jgi:trehalose 6-phosphate synthase
VPGLGGLATALLPVLHERGGAWIAMGEPLDDAPLDQPFPENAPRFNVRRLPLTGDEYEAFYHGMANRVLWPLVHYFVESVEPDRSFWNAYRTVNQRFAAAALECAADLDARAAPDDADAPTFWVHDYQLMLVPELIRAARPNARIGHFWHVPWPAPEVFRIVPSARALLRGILASDLIAFHTEGYAENFREGARDLVGAELVPSPDQDGYDVQWQGRRIRVEVHPIGIDVAGFASIGARSATARDAETTRLEAGGVERLIVGVDRLDYTKGLPLRLEAFERFLETYPQWHRRVTLFQVCTPSRTGIPAYDHLRRVVDETVGRINGRFAEGHWVPVRYRYRAYSQDELAVLYRAADVALVTPLRDGMNLVALEYAAVHAGAGALILSELTGAADYLDGAIPVNPYDTDGVVRTILEALEMSESERMSRMDRLRESLGALDVHRWADAFLTSLGEGGGEKALEVALEDGSGER